MTFLNAPLNKLYHSPFWGCANTAMAVCADRATKKLEVARQEAETNKMQNATRGDIAKIRNIAYATKGFSKFGMDLATRSKYASALLTLCESSAYIAASLYVFTNEAKVLAFTGRAHLLHPYNVVPKLPEIKEVITICGAGFSTLATAVSAVAYCRMRFA